jgi:S-adenosylmethionine:tRNA ribosyltransferase-isomerase
MHREFYSIDQIACDTINDAKSNGKKIVAVGTTAIRTLESAANFCGEKEIFPHSNHTNLFITMGYEFKIVDCLVTNFHLPKSTLFILVCAFLGSVELGQKLYRSAIEKKFRFFSYGDACFLMREKCQKL